MPTHDWFQMTVRHFQVFAAELTVMADVSDLERAIDVLLSALPGPPSRLASAIVGTLSSRTIGRIVDHFHPAHHTDECACWRVSANAIDSLLSLNNAAALSTFRDWFNDFLNVYKQHHPLCSACAAARLIRGSPKRRWRSHDLKPIMSITADPLSDAQVRNAFRLEFDMTPGEYLELVRLWHGLPLLFEGLKIESIAREVGYDSKKSFYHTFAKWLRLTPKQARLLDDTRREQLKANLARLLFKVCTVNTRARRHLKHSA
jgi:AraC-like DNA-binding protein